MNVQAAKSATSTITQGGMAFQPVAGIFFDFSGWCGAAAPAEAHTLPQHRLLLGDLPGTLTKKKQGASRQTCPFGKSPERLGLG